MRDTRIQKAMADQGMCSRRAAEQIILEGRVKLNGRPVQLGDKMDIKADILTVDGQRVVFDRKKEFYYYMLNKPRGYITTSKDDRGRKTVLDLVKDTPTRVYPVGRLDKDSEGLLLFTNDGNFANQLTHPSHQVSKLYRVTVRPTVTEEQLIALARTILSDPKILVLDEATSSIDAKTERYLQNGINHLLKGRTSFIIAHRLSTIRSCDKIMYINNKGITEAGSHDELMAKKGDYYKLYTAQAV